MTSPIYQCVFRRAEQQIEPCSSSSCTHEGLVDLHCVPNPEQSCSTVAILILSAPTNCLPIHVARLGGLDVAAITGWHQLIHSNSGQQSIIVEFAECDNASQLFSVANGKLFNESNPSEICYTLPLQYIIGLECCSVTESNFPSLLSPNPDHQIPCCPRCLERLDVSISGLPPPNCLHRFQSPSSQHSCHCVSSWSNINCKLCLNVQSSSTGQFYCETCSNRDRLWICLLCCHIGCNRFHKSHAIEHFHSTGHRYSLELTNTISLWDYKGDGYIHRILPGDSKYDSTSSPRRQTVFKKPTGEGDDSVTDAKLESLIMYYNQMLVSQLQAQIDHFDLNMSKEHDNQTIAIRQKQERVSLERSVLQQFAGKEASLSKTLSIQQRKLAKTRGKLSKLELEIAQIKQSNIGVLKNIAQMNVELEALQAHREELQHARILELQTKINKTMQQLS